MLVTSSDDETLNTTLTETKKFKLNPIDDLKCFVIQVKRGQSAERFFITREKRFVNQIIGKYKNPSFDVGGEFSAESHSCGTEELGVDAGGPTKEFFRELMEEHDHG